jgi:SAM-dependent methyltransferase
MSDYEAFLEAERRGWSDPDRAANYVNLFAVAADQAIGPMLEAAGAGPGTKVIDLCCGHGNAADALSHRGCTVVGVDFSPAMLRHARERVPGASFLEGDVHDLPMPDGSFDAAVSNLGLCHAVDPARALAEVRRVLRPGGGFAMTTWCGPQASPCMSIIQDAVRAHGSTAVSPPPAPDFHLFATPGAAGQALRQAGFRDVRLEIIDCAWRLTAPGQLAEIFEKGTVRAAMVLSDQPPANLAAIRRAIHDRIRADFAVDDGWRVPMPAGVLSGRA